MATVADAEQCGECGEVGRHKVTCAHVVQAEMKPPPEPEPSAWDCFCEHCQRRTKVKEDTDENDLSYYRAECVECRQAVYSLHAALWGHEWAAVAMMAQAVFSEFLWGEPSGRPIPEGLHAALNEVRDAIKLPLLETSVWLARATQDRESSDRGAK